jgi:hypothetical protein
MFLHKPAAAGNVAQNPIVTLQSVGNALLCLLLLTFHYNAQSEIKGEEYRVIKSRRIAWAGSATRIGLMRNACKILVGKSEGLDGNIILEWLLGK